MLQSLTKKNIFLLDGFGALLSAGVTGGLLPLFHQLLGLPVELLYQLTSIPILYAAFSLCCYFFVKTTKPWMLIIIMIANVSYCILSGLILTSHKSITILGQTFLIFEILVVLAVVAIELNVYRNSFLRKKNII